MLLLPKPWSLCAKPFIWKRVLDTGSFSFKSNLFLGERFCTEYRFETEAQGNSKKRPAGKDGAYIVVSRQNLFKLCQPGGSTVVGRHSGFMVSALVPRSSGPGSSPWPGTLRCVMFLGKILYFHSIKRSRTKRFSALYRSRINWSDSKNLTKQGLVFRLGFALVPV